MEPSPELSPIDLVERDFSMLFILSLFIIIFVFLGFMKIRWLEADVEEPARDPAAVDEESVRIHFLQAPGGPCVEVGGERVAVGDIGGEWLERMASRTESRKVEIHLDAQLETKDWFPVVYGVSKRARAVEFTTR
jgi:hypothetical protein